jgi:RHS repeat-associated protein
VAHETKAIGVVTSYTYDTASQLLTLAHQLGANTINSFTYTYDKVGNRKSKADGGGTANYTYDTLNRLTQAINPLPSNPLESFTYDPVGNRTNSNQNGSSTFNQANQLVEDSSFSYQYDNNGNLTRKTPKTSGPFTSYEYDAENRLVRVVINGTTANYRYDGLGRRVEKEVINVGTTVTRYVHDNEDILLELDGSNNIVARYTHGPGIDEPLIMEKNAQAFYYHADGLGSITELTNQSGTVAQRYTYSSFGKIESQLDANFIQPYTFTAREFDPETGQYFYRSRILDHAAGRFSQEDILRGSPNLPESFNYYAYVGNNPVTRKDPLGLWYIDINISGGFIIGGTGGILISSSGIYPYVGLGLTTPGVSGSITWSPSDPTTGWNIGAQAQYGVAFQRGYGFGEGGGWFTEIGAGWPPGASVMGYYVFGPFFGSQLKEPTTLCK